MKKFLAFLSFCLMISAQASIPTMSALGQGANGSYYLSDERNVFFNPTNMGEKYLNIESEGQAVWLDKDMGLVAGNSILGRDVLQGFFEINDMFAISPYFNLKNGEGFTIYGANIGMAYEDFLKAAVGGTVLKGKLLPYGNIQFKGMDNMAILYADYTKLKSKYSMTVGLGMDYGKLFSSVEFGKVASLRDLKMTVGGRVPVGDFSILGSAQQYMFFDTFTVLGLGASVALSPALDLDASTNFKAFGMASPDYADFDTKLALTYHY